MNTLNINIAFKYIICLKLETKAHIVLRLSQRSNEIYSISKYETHVISAAQGQVGFLRKYTG